MISFLACFFWHWRIQGIVACGQFDLYLSYLWFGSHSVVHTSFGLTSLFLVQFSAPIAIALLWCSGLETQHDSPRGWGGELSGTINILICHYAPIYSHVSPNDISRQSVSRTRSFMMVLLRHCNLTKDNSKILCLAHARWYKAAASDRLMWKIVSWKLNWTRKCTHVYQRVKFVPDKKAGNSINTKNKETKQKNMFHCQLCGRRLHPTGVTLCNNGNSTHKVSKSRWKEHLIIGTPSRAQ